LHLVAERVAKASALAPEWHAITAASAVPKLRECPTVPEEQHIARGVWEGGTFRPIFPDRGDEPANIDITAGEHKLI
jgi:hypothetical protein